MQTTQGVTLGQAMYFKFVNSQLRFVFRHTLRLIAAWIQSVCGQLKQRQTRTGADLDAGRSVTFNTD